MTKFFKKYHKWLSLGLTIFILLFSLSGIVLNHRGLFSGIDVKRSILPSDYEYNNWNRAAVKNTERIGYDSILIYGNIGIFLTNSSASYFKDFNNGFGKGVDNHKVERVFLSHDGTLYAGTLFGLYQYDYQAGAWKLIFRPRHNPRIVDIASRGDTLIVMSRSFLFQSTDNEHFNKLQLPAPIGYKNKIGLFKTLWVIHSGEIYGDMGKLFVDFVALVFIFLSITGLVYFVIPLFLKRKMKRHPLAKTHKLRMFNRWSLKWHNKIGWITIVFLIVTTFTGMFLRPPLLAVIAYSQVSKIPFTELDSPNPWFDKLRRIIVDNKNKLAYIATPDGIYVTDSEFNDSLSRFAAQPPLSIMGVNTFEQIDDKRFLVGSFEGLFVWDIKTKRVYDAIKQHNYRRDPNKTIPLGDYLVTGFSEDFDFGKVYFDFNSGAAAIGNPKKFVDMPLPIKNQDMSLWNVALEIHTARMYGFMFGKLYILFIPLLGLIVLFILISGFIVWWKKH
ncbi:MAG: PepSY domain-containing protein [Chlorobi bacterium]|nr:PepSY domain-containing protein [Chlorobiota bacterium]